MISTLLMAALLFPAAAVAKDPAADRAPRIEAERASPTGPLQQRERRRRRPSMVGYIENTAVESQIRVRFDAGTGNDVPDRAEFFYAKCGCYIFDPEPNFDPDAPGPGPGVPTELNFQQYYLFGEYAVRGRVSLFAELPFRGIQPQGFVAFGPPYDPFPDHTGVGDLRFGAKIALLSDENRALTFQVRASAPTGDAAKGLGTNNWSIEPVLLFHQNLAERAGIEAQFGFWSPLEGSRGVPTDAPEDFSGNVLFYGVGPSFDIVSSDKVRFGPVVELVGWRVLGGFQTKCTVATCDFDAEGINIVNLKLGARAAFANRNSLYAGFGWGLTDDVWYDKLFRVEYRYSF